MGERQVGDGRDGVKWVSMSWEKLLAREEPISVGWMFGWLLFF